MKKIVKYVMLFMAIATLCGCRAVDNANRASNDDLAAEGSVVFTRPAKFYPFFGSYSISEFVEITYEKVSRNSAGLPVVEVGIRNRGPVLWTNWYENAPKNITLNAVCSFYQGTRVTSPTVYSTNHRKIVIPRGETYVYKAVCPVKNAESYQLVLGD